jgi:histidinol-phosphate phosphatase family protein
MQKAVFLDRDGTINIDTGYIKDPKDLVFIRGSKKAVKILKEKGFLVYIITNQSGVGRGYFSIEDVQVVNKKLIEKFEKYGVFIDGIFSCPHRPDEGCNCRKPNPDVVNDIAKKNNISLAKSYFVGDKLTDVETGQNAGCKTILIEGESAVAAKAEKGKDPDYFAKNLLKAVEWIVKETE